MILELTYDHVVLTDLLVTHNYYTGGFLYSKYNSFLQNLRLDGIVFANNIQIEDAVMTVYKSSPEEEDSWSGHYYTYIDTGKVLAKEEMPGRLGQ